MKTLDFRIKTVYGVDKMYLVDASIAREIEKLTGCKTVTDLQYGALESLGFTFRRVF